MIDSSAKIAKSAEVDDGVEIGPYCVVGPNVRIKKGTKLISHVVVDGWTEIGEDNLIFPFTYLGAIPQDLKYKGEKTHLKIGDSNTIREGVTINLGTVQGGGVTSLGSNNLLMSYVHLGHDCQIGNHCIIATHCALAGHVVVEDYANIGGMVGISQFLNIGAYSYIGGQSGIEKDVLPFSIALGQRPPHIRGANIVGLRRRGFAAETIQIINETIKLWIRPEVPKEQCLLEIESQYGDNPEIQQLVQFIKKSTQGIIK